MNLVQIHEATVAGDRTAKSFAGSALDCILHAEECGPNDLAYDPALTQAMVYAQLATAAATAAVADRVDAIVYVLNGGASV